MVSCSVYLSCFDSTTLADMNSCLNGETHGPVHILAGGEWHAAEEDFIQKVGEMIYMYTFHETCFVCIQLFS